MSKVDTGSDGNLMPFRMLKIPFPKSTIAKLQATENKHNCVKTHNQSNIEQLDMCTVKLDVKHNTSNVGSLLYQVMAQHYLECQICNC